MLTEVITKQWAPDREAISVTPEFNLSWWGIEDKYADCGYSACACGHAGLDPRFIEQGLTMRDNTMYYKTFQDWTAVREFFGIDKYVSELLFMKHTGNSNYYDTESDVIKRIVRLLEVGQIKFIKEFS
jgi:hypothetical protein